MVLSPLRDEKPLRHATMNWFFCLCGFVPRWFQGLPRFKFRPVGSLPSWWPGWGFQEPKLPENQLPDGPVPVPTTVSDAETCQALMLGLFIDTVVSWVIGVPPVIIHFERWDFPWNKPTILDTPFYGNHHIWCFWWLLLRSQESIESSTYCRAKRKAKCAATSSCSAPWSRCLSLWENLAGMYYVPSITHIGKDRHVIISNHNDKNSHMFLHTTAYCDLTPKYQ